MCTNFTYPSSNNLSTSSSTNDLELLGEQEAKHLRSGKYLIFTTQSLWSFRLLIGLKWDGVVYFSPLWGNLQDQITHLVG